MKLLIVNRKLWQLHKSIKNQGFNVPCQSEKSYKKHHDQE